MRHINVHKIERALNEQSENNNKKKVKLTCDARLNQPP